MVNILDDIPRLFFEAGGTIIGGLGVIAICTQVISEWKNKRESSLSFLYILFFLLIYLFWTIYGVRFRLIAVGFTNFIAMILQLSLLVVWIRKKNKFIEI